MSVSRDCGRSSVCIERLWEVKCLHRAVVGGQVSASRDCGRSGVCIKRLWEVTCLRWEIVGGHVSASCAPMFTAALFAIARTGST